MADCCTIEDCIRPAVSGGLCSMHIARRHYNRPMTAPAPLPNRDRFEILADAARRYCEADEDVEYRMARQNLIKAAQSYGKRQLVDRLAERIRQSLRARKAAGLPVGRPAVMTHAQARAAVEAHGSLRRAARALGVSKSALARALFRVP